MSQTLAVGSPKDLIEEQLAAIWREILELPAVGTQEDFFELGGTSLETVRIIGRIKSVFGRELRPKVMIEAPTIEKMADVLRADPLTNVPVVLELRRTGSRPPLFCIPGAGGNIVVLRDVWLNFPDDLPVYGIEPKLIGEEVAPQTRVEDIAAGYLKDILPVQPHGPYYLAGYCFGALVAFEMARQLIAAGEQAAFVGLLDPPLPGLQNPAFAGGNHGAKLARFLRKGPHEQWNILRILAGRFQEKLAARVHRVGLSFGGSVGAAAEPDRRFLNINAAIEYRPEPIDAPLVLFLAQEGGDSTKDIARVWQQYGTGVECEMVPGAHVSFVQGPNAASLAQRIVKHLDTCQSASEARSAAAS